MSVSPRRAFLSPHAHQRCIEMGVTRADVVHVLSCPTTSYPSHPKFGPGRRTSTLGNLAVVHTENFEVITVLWNGQTSRAAGPLIAA